ncbi:MAG: MarR family transcriptional regulator, partial [Ruminococcus sp.]|nr:MarR family transcriptional regulator [Candidatus Copronaster equi]
YIYSHEYCSQDDVSVALKTDKTTVGKALASLEKKNCVVRNQDTEDKRFKRLSLTADGHKKVAELVDIHNNWLYEIMKCLTDEEKKNFENYCDRMLTAAEKLSQK